MPGVIPFTEEDVKKHLDNVIERWRDIRDDTEKESRERFAATCYIDAYQSVKLVLFGELLQEGEEK